MNGEMMYESFQCPMSVPSNLDTEFAETALKLLHRRFGMRYPIRKLTIRGKDLQFNTSVYQLSFEYDAVRREKAMALAACVDELNDRVRRSVVRGVELADARLTGLGSKPNQQFAPAGWY
jgi:hypothetical protein